MEEDTEVLDEVVVVGYGAQKKESVVGAISQVSSKELLKSPAANVSQAIAGKIPGVITSQTSGAPGADDMKIYIRGRASFAGDNQPLILVDGVEREFSQIAPDDIESISTLKVLPLLLFMVYAVQTVSADYQPSAVKNKGRLSV